MESLEREENGKIFLLRIRHGPLDGGSSSGMGLVLREFSYFPLFGERRLLVVRRVYSCGIGRINPMEYPLPIRAPSQSYRRGFGAYMRYILPLSCNLVSTYPIEPVPRGTIVTGSTHTAAISSPVGPVPRGTIVSSGNQRLSTRAKGRFVGRIEKRRYLFGRFALYS